MNEVPPLRHAKAFSLVEMLVAIAVIGVLAAVAIPAFSNIGTPTKDVEAKDFTESLNKALRSYGQACWEIETPANNSATTDEFLVLRSLQYQWPSSSLKPGSPFFSPNYNPSESSDSTKHRIRWNGKFFEALLPGTAGTGFLKTFTGSDSRAAAYTFPANYAPIGPS
jgi:prepilin-type N-terminal cleavage/methylation domain-containing protein